MRPSVELRPSFRAAPAFCSPVDPHGGGTHVKRARTGATRHRNPHQEPSVRPHSAAGRALGAVGQRLVASGKVLADAFGAEVVRAGLRATSQGE